MTDDPCVKLVRLISGFDFDGLVKEVFGRDYCLQQAGLYSQDTLIHAEVDADPEYVRHSLTRIAQWRESPLVEDVGRDETVGVEIGEFLAGLYHHGKLAPGLIYIHVWC